MKKMFVTFIVIIVIVVAYLFAAHFYIYKVIRMAGLPATDTRHEYHLNQASTKQMIYVSLGDSLTAGAGAAKYEESYPYLLAQKMANKDLHVVNYNYSYPGARTEDLIQNLLPKAIAEKPDMVTLLIGTNDVHGLLGLNKIVTNYEQILKELTTKTEAKINIISVPNIGSNSLLLPPYNIYFEKSVESLNVEIKFLAEKYNANYIDLTSPTSETLRRDGNHYSKDKFHPSATGYKEWAAIIYDYLNF